MILHDFIYLIECNSSAMVYYDRQEISLYVRTRKKSVRNNAGI